MGLATLDLSPGGFAFNILQILKYLQDSLHYFRVIPVPVSPKQKMDAEETAAEAEV